MVPDILLGRHNVIDIRARGIATAKHANLTEGIPRENVRLRSMAPLWRVIESTKGCLPAASQSIAITAVTSESLRPRHGDTLWHGSIKQPNDPGVNLRRAR